ncbi:MAG TPA: ABC transporter ATP-binding protein [Candidatus Cloacimonetes bacterium]|nr:ABC transporter ATP-binding protein [Candidatus Cloacimonadota bacterium]HEX37653.1 ABC transporter ATP-binding protein [Candidatus Cloacimonadota bacterium]
MRRHSSAFEEEKDTGKVLDAALMKRLLRYLAPYKIYFIISLFILIIVAFFAIAIPYITKYAIDEYINPSLKILSVEDHPEIQEHFKKRYKKFIYEQVDGKILLHSYNIDKLLPKHYKLIIKKDLISKEIYAAYPINNKNTKVADEYPEYLKKFGDYYIIQQSDFGNLSVEATRSLRSNDISGLKTLAIIFFVLLILRFVFSYAQIYMTQYGAMHSMYDLRMKLFNHLMKLPMSFFDKNPIGRLVTRVTNDVNALSEMLGEGLITLVQDLFMMLAILIVMLIINWKLALITFVVLPFVVFFMLKFKVDIRKVYRMVRIRLAKINASLSENISGIQTIQLFHQEETKQQEFEEITQEYYNAEKKQLRVFAVFRPLIDVMVHLAIALILWYGGGSIIQNRMSLGVLVVFISYVHRFFDPLYDLSQKYNVMQSAMAALERIFKLMDEKEEEYPQVPEHYTRLKGEIEFKNVWMAYEKEDWILKDVNLKIQEGEKVALVGSTGGGKTTLVKLISSFYPFQKGDILIDRKSIKQYNLEELRNNIGVVQQDVFIFSGKIRDNISLFRSDITEEEIVQAAKYVNADRFISKLPKGYDDDAKERGSVLSAGQRQLLAFARVLVGDPSIFVLDEATSNIDTETEMLIQDALQKVMENRTSIIIAHRLSTIQHVDRIVVIHKGRIAEEGSHQELLKQRGIYYKLYELQYKGMEK